MTTQTKTDKAEIIATTLNHDGYQARVWQRGEHVRVYVSRQLSKRRQDMGYVEVLEHGINANGLTRQQATIRDIAEAAIAE